MPPATRRAWSTPEDIAARVRRRWESGELLREYGSGSGFTTIEIPLRGPGATDIGDDIAAAQQWVRALDRGRNDDRRYTLQWREVGGRNVGRNRLPSRAIVSDFAQAWALLGVGAAVRRFDELLEAAQPYPPVRAWLLARPLRGLEAEAVFPELIAAYGWLHENRGSGRYLREISAPGVDTKFAEQHRVALAAMLGVSASASGFLRDLGLRARPELVRFRPSPGLGVPGTAFADGVSELAIGVDDLALLAITPKTAIVVENEVSYLSVDVPPGGIVLWGKGFEIDRIGRLPWLAAADLVYWGDLDTHGFAILDRLRAWHPHTRSVLMDRETLLAHRERWGTENTPTAATLRHLTPAEHALYVDLVSETLGDRIRLEQERIDWEWVRSRLPTE